MARILLIDDSEIVRDFVTLALENEHEVKTSGKWTEVITMPDIDLILLDIKMPGLWGDKVAEFLRGALGLDEYRIVIYSSLEEDEVRAVAEKIGALGYIVKQPNPQYLRDQVQRYAAA